MVRYAPNRSAYLARLLRWTRIRAEPLRTTQEWREKRHDVYDLLFLFLYGLPLSVQVEVALKALSRYQPNYAVAYPADMRPQQVIDAAGQWLANPQQGIRMLLGCELADIPRSESHLEYLMAVWYLRQLLMHGQKTAVLCAATAAGIIRSCIQQRVEDVWRADDPVAASLWRREEQILWEIGEAEAEGDTARVATLDTEWHQIMETVAVARRLDIDNVACWAVERREWHVLHEWLQPIAQVYPRTARPTRRDRRFWCRDQWHLALL